MPQNRLKLDLCRAKMTYLYEYKVYIGSLPMRLRANH